MKSPIHPINDTKRLIEEIQAFLPTMIDRRRPETHQDGLHARVLGQDIGGQCTLPDKAPQRR
jgi:hypothetical protein